MWSLYGFAEGISNARGESPRRRRALSPRVAALAAAAALIAARTAAAPPPALQAAGAIAPAASAGRASAQSFAPLGAEDRAPRLSGGLGAAPGVAPGPPDNAQATNATLSPPPANSQLDALVAEAMADSPLVVAARARWRAASKMPVQAATLPDPEVTLQEFTVGGPKPAEGYETSDFYYTGVGAEQEIPGPGKLRLAAAAASHQAESAHHQYLARQREVAERVRETYFNLFYGAKALAVFEASHADLVRIAEIAEAQYRLGIGRQQDVYRAQFQATELLKEIAAAREEIAAGQAALKALLGRDPDSGDIQIGEVTPSAMKASAPTIAAAAAGGSEELKAAQATEARDAAALELAHRGYWPDFRVGYMYQKTGPGFRDYFMLTFGAKVPLYFWRKQTPAIEQAAAEHEAAVTEVRAARLEALAQARAQLLALRTAERMLTIYREGLIPQAETAEAAALSDYRAGRVDFQTLLGAALDLLSARQSYWRTLADHEIAAARLHQIIGDAP